MSAMLFALIFPRAQRAITYDISAERMATVGSAIVCDRLRLYGNRSLCDRLRSAIVCDRLRSYGNQPLKAIFIAKKILHFCVLNN